MGDMADWHTDYDVPDEEDLLWHYLPLPPPAMPDSNLTPTDPKDLWAAGYICCLATFLQITGESTTAREVLEAFGDDFAGVDEYDMAILREHGMLDHTQAPNTDAR